MSSKFVVYLALVYVVSLVSVHCLPVPDEVNPGDEVDSDETFDVDVVDEGETGLLVREQRAADPHHHHRGGYGGGGCRYNCGGYGGGRGGYGGGSGSVAQAGAASFNNGGFRPYGGGGGSSANAQAASFNVNTPLGNFGASQASSISSSFGK